MPTHLGEGGAAVSSSDTEEQERAEFVSLHMGSWVPSPGLCQVIWDLAQALPVPGCLRKEFNLFELQFLLL